MSEEPPRGTHSPALVDRLAEALLASRTPGVHTGWTAHQDVAAVLDELQAAGYVVEPKPSSAFRGLSRGQRAAAVLAVVLSVQLTLLAAGLLAWATVAVWSRALS